MSNGNVDFEYVRDRFETILKISSEKRDEENLYELMKLTSNFKIFEAIALNSLHKEICKYITLKVFEKGEIIFKQGDEGDAYYFILRGCIDVYIYDVDPNDGKTKLLLVNTVQPGNGFGELSLLYDCPRTATCLSSNKSDLIVIKKKIYNTFVKDLHEKELFDLVNFYSSIPIFKNEPISNILKLCLKTTKKSLASFAPFHKYGDYINDYYFVLTGSLKAVIKLKMSKHLITQLNIISKESFVHKVKCIQDKELNDDIYQEVVSIMEYKQGDMVCEFYAAKQHKLNLYLLPDQPTKLILIKTEDTKRLAPNIHDIICKYSIPIFNLETTLSKLYEAEKWKMEKSRLLKSVLSFKN